ncbi:MAG: SusC/RagA family TonB-linked outer membrane protein [Tannerellaceae bacterium]|nr:SusC/RagA family TonB-linked outer membrane protein [Tannerellaceae bacterium]
MKDSKGELLIGVNVRDVTGNKGTITNVDGQFTLDVEGPATVLSFSYIGFSPQEVTVGNRTVLNIVMKEDTYQIQEVVVVAYGTQSKATLTGALSVIGTEDLTKVPTTSLTNTLAGLLPGASTVQTTGQPGNDAAQIFIRGSGSLNNSRSKPLIMVDGVERDFTQIDPNEIESISVLKDASSTAVFGVRGANGVILVTTKRGKTGEPSISASSTLGVQQPISLIEAAGSYDYARFWNARQSMDNRTNVFTPEQIEAYRTGSDPMMYPDVSWIDYMFNKSFLQSNNNVNISGGTENIKYFVSLGYLYQDGLLKQFSSLPYDNNYRYNRYNYRGNIDAKLTPSTDMKLNIGGYVRDVQEPRVVIILLSCIFISCDDMLDFDETNRLTTKEDLYKYFSSTENLLSDVYSYLSQDLGVIDGAMRDCATDDAEFARTGALVQDITNGSWSALNTVDGQWSYLYTGIRAANAFITDIGEVDFSRFEYDGRYEQMMIKLGYFPYEARLLRCHFFFELARRYGDIAMPLIVLTTDEANSIEKTPFQEVIHFIVKECDEIAPNLPVTYKGITDQTGRMVRGYAMALKSKALLYAASRRHNPSMDKEKWKTSAKAALDLINASIVNGWYELDSRNNTNNIASKEVIMFRLNGDNNTFELINFPVRFTSGESSQAGTCPSQNIVDAFETINGYPVVLTETGWQCEDPVFDPQKPYANRDPRFAATILADGMAFKESVIETYAGGRDEGPVSLGGTPTGYYLRKYIQPTSSFEPGNLVTNKHLWIIYRYAETLLTYAESMIEAFDHPNYTDATYTRSALWALNEVRNAAGMPLITAAGKDEFIERLRNEWRVEFAFEDHRFWDIRRWQIGNQTQTLIYGAEIDLNDSGGKTYSRFLYESRYWNDKMYFYPIPQSELFKNTNLAPQNSGW